MPATYVKVPGRRRGSRVDHCRWCGRLIYRAPWEPGGPHLPVLYPSGEPHYTQLCRQQHKRANA